jgi:SAM-dependent methyltransferase
MFSPGSTRGFGLFERFLAKKRAQLADSLIPRPFRSGRILDIGCGMNPAFLQTTAFSEKYGIDKAGSLSCHTKFDEQLITFIHHDIESGDPFPFYDEFCDVVTMLAVIEHISPNNLSKVIAELYRVLKRGGLLIITTPSHWTGFILNGMSLLRLISRQEVKDHKELYTSDDIMKALQLGGFAPGNMQQGCFEFYMNTWIMAIK